MSYKVCFTNQSIFQCNTVMWVFFRAVRFSTKFVIYSTSPNMTSSVAVCTLAVFVLVILASDVNSQVTCYSCSAANDSTSCKTPTSATPTCEGKACVKSYAGIGKVVTTRLLISKALHNCYIDVCVTRTRREGKS